MSTSPRMTRLRAAAALAGVVMIAGALTLGPAAPAGAVTGQFWVSKLQLTKVWKITRGAGVTVAVVDTGVPPTRDLGSRLLTGHNFVTGSGSGQVDAGVGTGGIGGTYSHGQNMAEIIAGDGSDGISGIAPQATILPVKVLDRTNGNGSETAVVSGIRYAVRHKAQVINASLGQDQPCDASVAAAVEDAYRHDVIVVAGTGDSGVGSVDAPANCPGVLAVSGIASNAAIWSGSNYGPQVELTNFAKDIPGVTSSGHQGPTNGTSAAAAFTSGELALLRAKFPKDSARAIVTRLLYGIDTLSKVRTGTRVNNHVGYGVPVPLDELRDTVPSDAPDPIYDALARRFGPGPGPSSSGSSGSSEPSTPPASGTSGSSSASGGGSSVGPIVIVVVVVLVLGGIVVAVVARSRRRRPPTGQGPPPPGYGRR